MRHAAFSCIWVTLIALQIAALLSTTVWADGLKFNSEHNYSQSDGRTKIKTTGQSFDTDFTRFDQRYNLNLSKTIYPYLLFETGTIYEINKLSATTDGDTTDFEERVLSPFAEINLNNPIYKAGLAVRKRRIDESISGLPDTRADRDEITTTLGMTPPELFPEWFLRYSHIHTYDDPETVDQIRKVLEFDTAYRPLRNLSLDYAYLRVKTDERTFDFDTLEQNHFGKIQYAHNFFDNRLSMGTSYTLNYTKLEFTSGTGSAEIPLLRSAGLFSLDNTPDDGPALSANPALIDGNVVTSAGIDIGTNGDQTQAVNIGVDLGLPQTVDQIRIWVDRELTAVIANSFSWDVYTSPDNTDLSVWTLVATVSPAAFGTFETRFEISFAAVNTRFIKVVTRPLSLVVPGANNFPNIFVTEIQAFITQSGADADTESEVTDHNYSLNLTGRLSDKTTVGYTLLYSQQNLDPQNEKRTQLSNGINLSHIFNNTFSSSAYGQRTDRSVLDEDDINYTYGAALKAAWLRTFNQSLTYSGIYEDSDFGTAYQNSIFLRSNSILYRGWSAFVDVGYSWEEPVDGSQINSYFLRPGTNFQPHRKVTLNLDYQYKRTEQSGLDIGPRTESKWDVQAFYTPLDTLSLFARINGVERDGSTNTFQNYTVTWSPFRDGDLQFFFRYNESLISEGNQKQRVVGPSLKWTIGRHIFLDTSYSYNLSDSDFQKVTSNVLSANLRMIF